MDWVWITGVDFGGYNIMAVHIHEHRRDVLKSMNWDSERLKNRQVGTNDLSGKSGGLKRMTHHDYTKIA